MNSNRILLALLLTVPLTGLAEQPPELQPLPDAPLPPPPTPTGEEEELEPEVTIIKRGKDVIHEYRINGQLYMVKIVPGYGFPYYLIDRDGDGQLESRYNKLEPDILVPSWMIYRW
ncbi:MAG: DUF2782 domain-containing protein [Pseudomonadota bacterium]